ncbi:hypothetical protein V6N13_132888 [Hibiscus sabdariffa]
MEGNRRSAGGQPEEWFGCDWDRTFSFSQNAGYASPLPQPMQVSFQQVNGPVYPLGFSDATATPSLPRRAEQHLMQNYGCSDYGGVSLYERALSPGMPISFTDQNATLQPPSPLHFSEYFDGPNEYDGLNQMLGSQTHAYGSNDVPSRPHFGKSFAQENPILRSPSPVIISDYFDGPIGLDEMLYPETQGLTDGSVQPNDLMSHLHLAFSDNSIQATPSPGLPQQGDQLPMQSYGWPGSSSSNQLLHIPSSSQNPSRQNHRKKKKPLSKDQLSKDQIYRLRLKAKQEVKDKELGNKDEEIALLKSEIEMLKNNKNEEIALLKSEIEMLRRKCIYQP